MSLDTAFNFAIATVSTGYDAAATSIVLSASGGARFGAVPFYATWWNATDYAEPSDDPSREIVRVTGIATDTLTITRGQQTTQGGLAASDKNLSGKTYKLQAGVTADVINFQLGYYPNGIADPPSAPTVVPTGTGATVYGYSIVLTNGIGFTIPSPERRVTNAASLDVSHFNAITTPIISDPNVMCFVIRTTGPNAPAAVQFGTSLYVGPCNGATVTDGVNATRALVSIPDSNTTVGQLLPGYIGTNSGGLDLSIAYSASIGGAINAAFGQRLILAKDLTGGETNEQGIWYVDPTGFGFYNSGDYGFSGWFQNVQTADSSGPYQLTRFDGFIKCDSSTGNVTVVFPDPSLFPTGLGTGTSNFFGRVFTCHKPFAANSVTLSSDTGQTFDGQSTVVLTAQYASATYYWDGVEWASMDRRQFNQILGNLIVPGGTPPSASAAGTTGTVLWDSNFIYVCVNTNTWKRVGISTW